MVGMNRSTDEEHRQQGKHVGLQEGHQQLNETDEERHRHTHRTHAITLEEKYQPQKGTGHKVTTKHVGEESNRQHAVFDKESRQLQQEDDWDNRRRKARRDEALDEAARPIDHQTTTDGHNKNRKSYGKSEAEIGSGGAADDRQGDHSHQVQGQDKAEHRHEKRQERLSVLRAHGGVNQLISNEQEELLKEEAKDTLWDG